MTANIAPAPRPLIKHRGAAVVLATLIAVIGWAALGSEFDRSVSLTLSKGGGWAEALFLYFRFFTNLTNIGIAILMTWTAIRLLVGRAPPPARIFNAGLIYILMTGATYELLLRSQWNPRGVQFFNDLAVHDVVPALTLTFWIAFAPREGAHWRDALWMLVYPTVYFTTTLVLGGLGQGYPYDFIDVSRLGYAAVLAIGLVFIALFYALGLIATALSKSWASRRTSPDAAQARHQPSALV